MTIAEELIALSVSKREELNFLADKEFEHTKAEGVISFLRAKACAGEQLVALPLELWQVGDATSPQERGERREALFRWLKKNGFDAHHSLEVNVYLCPRQEYKHITGIEYGIRDDEKEKKP
jgi:hypothetical protein